jgi:hypothetical protein
VDFGQFVCFDYLETIMAKNELVTAILMKAYLSQKSTIQLVNEV